MKKPYTVFLSATKRDKELAQDLAERLQAVEGVRVLFAEDMSAKGQNFSTQVVQGLSESDEVVFLVTENALNNQWLNYEAGAAEGLEKMITPILVGVEPERVPSVLNDWQSLKWSRVKDYVEQLQQRVAAKLESELTKKQAPTQTLRKATTLKKSGLNPSV